MQPSVLQLGPVQTATVILLLGLLFPSSSAAAQETATEVRELKIQIQPVFYVESDADAGGNIDLESAWAGGGSTSDTVRVKVHTNRGVPYRIVQQLEQDLLSERGHRLSEKQVLFSVSDGLHGGQSEVKGPRALAKDRLVIFTSNRQGDADEFTLSYLNSSKKMVPAGTYRARILIDGELQ